MGAEPTKEQQREEALVDAILHGWYFERNTASGLLQLCAPPDNVCVTQNYSYRMQTVMHHGREVLVPDWIYDESLRRNTRTVQQ
jgi:hypothetical protein